MHFQTKLYGKLLPPSVLNIDGKHPIALELLVVDRSSGNDGIVSRFPEFRAGHLLPYVYDGQLVGV